jgi:acyl-coenzyme A synthetase/AMP-(fatty) acid ligase
LANKEGFIHVPNRGGQSILAYRTGENIRRHPVDGEPQFIGRVDKQVKILDCRLELREIEQALLCNSLVSDKIALVQDEGVVEARLMAFITLRPGDRSQDLVSEKNSSDDIGALNAWTEMYNGAVYPEVGPIASR